MRGPRGFASQRATRFSGDISRPSSSPLPSFLPLRRDSDASSLASSRLSSVSSTPRLLPLPSPPSHLLSVNSYLSSLSPPLLLHSPLPSSSSLSSALRLLLLRLHFPHPLSDLPRDLPPLLSAFRCPFKLAKSALKAPTSPHSWPSVLSVLHWLVQLARVSDHLSSSSSPPPSSEIDINSYITRSYSLFLAGDDAAVADLESDYLDKLKRHAEESAKEVDALEAEVSLYEERKILREDARKFGNVVEKYAGQVEERRERVRERERELEEREREVGRVEEENEGLRERIRGQPVSAREVERMEVELRIVERDVAERERRRDEMEREGLRLDSELERRFREIEILAEESNAAIRKYVLWLYNWIESCLLNMFFVI